MNELINQVTPRTRGVIWLTKDESQDSNPYYSQLDYLLDGLLTANLRTASKVFSRVFIGNSFDKSFFVMIIHEFKKEELESFLTLFQEDLVAENDIIVIDEKNQFNQIKNELKSIASHIRLIQ